MSSLQWQYLYLTQLYKVCSITACAMLLNEELNENLNQCLLVCMCLYRENPNPFHVSLNMLYAIVVLNFEIENVLSGIKPLNCCNRNFVWNYLHYYEVSCISWQLAIWISSNKYCSIAMTIRQTNCLCNSLATRLIT